jgi:hypothetical protein
MFGEIRRLQRPNVDARSACARMPRSVGRWRYRDGRDRNPACIAQPKGFRGHRARRSGIHDGPNQYRQPDSQLRGAPCRAPAQHRPDGGRFLRFGALPIAPGSPSSSRVVSREHAIERTAACRRGSQAIDATPHARRHDTPPCCLDRPHPRNGPHPASPALFRSDTDVALRNGNPR